MKISMKNYHTIMYLHFLASQLCYIGYLYFIQKYVFIYYCIVYYFIIIYVYDYIYKYLIFTKSKC